MLWEVGKGLLCYYMLCGIRGRVVGVLQVRHIVGERDMVVGQEFVSASRGKEPLGARFRRAIGGYASALGVLLKLRCAT